MAGFGGPGGKLPMVGKMQKKIFGFLGPGTTLCKVASLKSMFLFLRYTLRFIVIMCHIVFMDVQSQIETDTHSFKRLSLIFKFQLVVM